MENQCQVKKREYDDLFTKYNVICTNAEEVRKDFEIKKQAMQDTILKLLVQIDDLKAKIPAKKAQDEGASVCNDDAESIELESST